MNNRKQRSFFLFFALFLISIISEVKAENVLNLKQNDTVSGEVTIGDLSFPLPDGGWTVVLKTNVEGSVSYNSGWQEMKIPMVNILLAQREGNSLKRFLRFIVNIKKPDISVRIWRDDPCKLEASNIYFSEKFNSGYEHPECLEIHPVYSFLEASGAYWSDVRSWMGGMNVSIPKTVIVVKYSKFTSSRYVEATIWVNPEQDGFKREGASLAALNGWYPENLDQQKKAYISGLIDWSKGFANNIRRRF